MLQLYSCHTDSWKNTKNVNADATENNSAMHYLTTNSNNTNNSSNGLGHSCQIPFVNPFCFTSSVILLCLSVLLWNIHNQRHFVHNKQGWKIHCGCQQRDACWCFDWHWIFASMVCGWFGSCWKEWIDLRIANWGVCSSLPSWCTQASTVVWTKHPVETGLRSLNRDKNKHYLLE